MQTGDFVLDKTHARVPMALVAPYAKIVLVQYIVKMGACVRCLEISANVEMVSTDQGAIKGITI